MMNSRYSQPASLAALFMMVAGCAAPQTHDYVRTREVAFSDPSAGADQLWEAAQETLRRHRFQLDRVERRSGTITTLPLTSQHFFEIWRHDVDTRHDFWEATLNPIRRWVEVTMTCEAERPAGALSVRVHKERLSSPDRQFNNSGAAYQFFSDALPSTIGAEYVSGEGESWLGLGSDGAMEDYLLRAILARSGLAGH